MYLSGNSILHNDVYKLVCAGDMFNVGIRMSEKEGIMQFKYEMVIWLFVILILTQLLKTINTTENKSFQYKITAPPSTFQIDTFWWEKAETIIPILPFVDI